MEKSSGKLQENEGGKKEAGEGTSVYSCCSISNFFFFI